MLLRQSSGENGFSYTEIIPETSATMFDGISLIQRMKENDQSFTQLAK